MIDDKRRFLTEIDALLMNGEQAMAVEVKTTCKRDYVDHHLKRMEKIRRGLKNYVDNFLEPWPR